MIYIAAMDKTLRDIKTILAHYFNSPVSIEGAEIMGSGYIHNTYKLTTDKGAFILQQFNSTIFSSIEEVNHNITILGHHLSQQQYPRHTLQIRQTLDKATYVTKADKSYRLIDFINDTICFDTIKHADQAFTASSAIGEWHRYTADFPHSELKPVLPNFINYQWRIDQMILALKNSTSPRLKASSKLRQLIDKHLHLLESFIKASKSSKLTTKIIHADPKISNILFHKSTSEVAGVIDLDTIMPGPLLIDFGEMVRSYTNLSPEDETNNAKSFSSDYFHATKEGFLRHVDPLLTQEDKIWLPEIGKVVTLVQAMRFMTDYLAGDMYYPTSYEGHNLDRAINQLNLLRSMINLI